MVQKIAPYFFKLKMENGQLKIIKYYFQFSIEKKANPRNYKLRGSLKGPLLSSIIIFRFHATELEQVKTNLTFVCRNVGWAFSPTKLYFANQLLD